MKKHFILFALALVTLSWAGIQETKPTIEKWDMLHFFVRNQTEGESAGEVVLLGSMYSCDGSSEDFFFVVGQGKKSLEDYDTDLDRIDRFVGSSSSTKPIRLRECLNILSENGISEEMLDRVGKNLSLLPDTAVGIVLQQGWEPLSYSSESREEMSFRFFTFRRKNGA